MPDYNASPNMNLPIPIPGITPGVPWATYSSASLTIIDGHTHAPGSGVQITPDGMNITSDLPFNANNAVSLKSTRFSSQSAVLSGGSDLNCSYVVSGDLYFNDGLGNHVRITQGGAVAGSPGSIANLSSPASASYVSISSTFVWQSAASTPANMDAAAYIFRNLSANSKGLTLSPPAAMGANFALTLPSLPASQKFMTLDSSGNMSAPWAVDNSTLEISANTLQVKASGIGTAQIADAAVTRAKLAAVGQQISSSCGSFTTTSGSFVDVTNLSVTLTTTGGPVQIMLVSDGAGANSYIGSTTSSASFTISTFRIVESGNERARYALLSESTGSSTSGIRVPPGAINHFYVPSASTYTYKVQASASSNTTSVINCKLVAWEL